MDTRDMAKIEKKIRTQEYYDHLYKHLRAKKKAKQENKTNGVITVGLWFLVVVKNVLIIWMIRLN